MEICYKEVEGIYYYLGCEQKDEFTQEWVQPVGVADIPSMLKLIEKKQSEVLRAYSFIIETKQIPTYSNRDLNQQVIQDDQ